MHFFGWGLLGGARPAPERVLDRRLGVSMMPLLCEIGENANWIFNELLMLCKNIIMRELNQK